MLHHNKKQNKTVYLKAIRVLGLTYLNIERIVSNAPFRYITNKTQKYKNEQNRQQHAARKL